MFESYFYGRKQIQYLEKLTAVSWIWNLGKARRSPSPLTRVINNIFQWFSNYLQNTFILALSFCLVARSLSRPLWFWKQCISEWAPDLPQCSPEEVNTHYNFLIEVFKINSVPWHLLWGNHSELLPLLTSIEGGLVPIPKCTASKIRKPTLDRVATGRKINLNHHVN